MTQTWRACYLEGKLGLMVLILIQSDISFYSFILLFSASFHLVQLQPGLTFNWLWIFSHSIKRIWKFYEVKKLQNSICVDWNFINQKISHSQETLQSLSPKTSLGPSTLVGSDHSQSTFVVRPRGTKLNTTKVYLVLFKEIRGNIMESSLQSSRGLKTFQSRDFLNGIKGWEDLHLEF